MARKPKELTKKEITAILSSFRVESEEIDRILMLSNVFTNLKKEQELSCLHRTAICFPEHFKEAINILLDAIEQGKIISCGELVLQHEEAFYKRKKAKTAHEIWILRDELFAGDPVPPLSLKTGRRPKISYRILNRSRFDYIE